METKTTRTKGNVARITIITKLNTIFNYQMEVSDTSDVSSSNECLELQQQQKNRIVSKVSIKAKKYNYKTNTN